MKSRKRELAWKNRLSEDKYLPPELLMRILARLPATAVLKSRCVCKTWCSMIDSPDFSSMHLKLYKPNHSEISHFLAMEWSNTDSIFTIRRSDTLKKVATVAKVSRSYLLRGSCHGLLLVRKFNDAAYYRTRTRTRDEQIRLWNPFIRKSLLVPPCPFSKAIVNLGFVRSSDDFKVVAFGYEGDVCNQDASVAVYSLNDQLWRIKTDRIDVRGWAVSYIGIEGGYVYSGSAIYWIGCDQHKPELNCDQGTHLISFNFDFEDFTFVQLPQASAIIKFLFLLGESVAIFTMSSESRCIWVLEQIDGSSLGWRLWFSERPDLRALKVLKPCRYPYTKVFFLQKSNTFLIETLNALTSYCITSQHIQLVGNLIHADVSLHTYVESLVFYNGHKGQICTSFP